jgi:ectoine hydroxylase-related dioxygenase (phytanoyl-CoA dioxygenase family)
MALLTSKSTVEDVSEVLDRDGVVVIEDLVGDTTLKDLWADLGPALDDVVYGDNNFSGQRTKRLHRRKRRHGVLPGSHRWEPERDPRPTEAASAVLWVGGLLHGGGAKLTEEARADLTIALTRANLRQEENQYLAVPPEIVREYPEEVQRLPGYDLCPPFLDWYEDHDPRSALERPRV